LKRLAPANPRVPTPALFATGSLTASSLGRLGGFAFNALVVGLWLWLYRPVFSYLSIIFVREDFRTNQIVLILVSVLIAYQLRRERVRPCLGTPPQWYLPAVVLALGGSVLFVLVERFLDINTLSASLFGLSSYGLLGLWMRPPAWHQRLPAALLVVGVLPFGEHMQTFVGYPMRILTASMVRDGLSAAGIPSIGVDTILVLENGVSQVDLPCSGVKSLWTGALFLIAATWIQHRAIDWRWFVIAAVFSALLFFANLARISTLVVVGQVMGSRLAAEMLHVPMGVLGFVAVCAAGVGMLHRAAAMGSDDAIRCPRLEHPRWLAALLAAGLFGLTLAYVPPPITGLTQPAPARQWPAEFAVQPMPLQPHELEWFARDSAASAERYRFAWRDIAGSMILITSSTWRAHHRPERCFEVYGLALGDSSTYLVAPDFPVRFVALSNRSTRETWSASYWFQSGQRVTDDYGTRIADDLSSPRNTWVLVSIIFDQQHDPRTAELTPFYLALRSTVAPSP
jgi:exosortase O